MSASEEKTFNVRDAAALGAQAILPKFLELAFSQARYDNAFPSSSSVPPMDMTMAEGISNVFFDLVAMRCCGRIKLSSQHHADGFDVGHGGFLGHLALPLAAEGSLCKAFQVLVCGQIVMQRLFLVLGEVPYCCAIEG